MGNCLKITFKMLIVIVLDKVLASFEGVIERRVLRKPEVVKLSCLLKLVAAC